jgi:hypothetical protein
MTFQPIVPVSGYSGWLFLDRTLDQQQETFSNSAELVRDTDYFRENIATVQTAEDLVSDRRLLSVALGAFGLDDDIDSQFFIRTILEEGTTSDEALANKLADDRYASFSAAFGFGDKTAPSTLKSGFATDIIDQYEVRQFEIAVGDQDNDLRLALSVDRGITEILDSNSTSDAQWYSILGNAAMKNVFETALGIPSSASSIDLEQQVEIYKERSKAVLGSDDLSDFTETAQQDKLVRMFLIRSEAANFSASSSNATALTLLQSAPSLYDY